MIYATNERFTLYQGDNRDVLKELADNCVDSIVTDPPYELGFMGKKWDASGIAFNVEVWQEALRVLKPGGHLLAFSGSRTYHRMAVAIEDAGFEIRDQIMWIYGSGFPKSMNIGKSIEAKLTTGSASKNGFHQLEGKRTGDGRIGMYDTVEEQGFRKVNPDQLGSFNLEPTTPEAAQWQGWGTALKPAHEPIVVARKPLIGTVAENVLTYGTGGLNIDGGRVAHLSEADRASATPQGKVTSNKMAGAAPDVDNAGRIEIERPDTSLGRWPANVIHDGSDEVVELFPDKAGGGHWAKTKVTGYGEFGGGKSEYFGQGEKDGFGTAARFFYCAKANKKDRNEGLDGFEEKRDHDGRVEGGVGGNNTRNRTNDYKQNYHPTVKPTSLMQYLCKLVTPSGGIVLDPFMGSGSTGKAAMYAGFNFIGIEMTEEYLPIAKARIEFAKGEADAHLPIHL